MHGVMAASFGNIFTSGGGGGAPITFGNQSTANVDSFPCSGDRAMASPFVLSAAASISSITARFTSASGGGGVGDTFKAFICTDTAGEPGSVLAVTAAATISALDAWITTTISASLAAGTYWLGVVGESFSARVQCVGSAGTMHMANGTFSYATPPATWPGTDGTYGIEMCIYAEGTAS